MVDEMLFNIIATLNGEIPLRVEGFSIMFACINGLIINGLSSNLIITLLPAIEIS